MTAMYALLAALIMTAMPVLAQDQPDSADIIAQMKTGLDLQDDQVTNITPIIEKYSVAFHDLQQSIDDGTINPSAIDSQRQGLEDSETHELSQYLKPYQLSGWRDMQGQMDKLMGQDPGQDDTSEEDASTDEYSNLPRHLP